MAASGRDATIFWNYVDLRFRAPADCQIEVALESNDLVVRIRALTDPGTFHHRTVEAAHELFVVDTEAESCELCGVASCFRHPAAAALPHEATTAWLVDNWTPEADAFVSERRAPKDTLLIPFESRRWGLGPYRWNAGGFATVRSAPFFVARRSATSRRLSDQGADRQRALLRMDEDLARIYARQIPPTALHIVVNQNLLPFLWRDGVLAGRTFDVLMTRLPLTHLEAQLDCAARRWPETATLTDFRAPREIADAESAALRAADNWITPHTAIAALAGPRAIQLPWQLPARVQRRRGARVVFPAATLARKGAFEIREALRELNLPLTVAGPNLESPEFWRGHDIRFANANWLDDAAVVVLPAWVEHRPNRLLEALAAGLPVIATKACGLDAREGVTIVPEGDVDSLVSALRQALN
jgi:hypothetical protein